MAALTPGGSLSLRSAAQALYNPPSEAVRQEADRWLSDFQVTTAAWNVTVQALQDDGEPAEVKFLAAQTLCTKVRRDFDEVPEADLSGLREALAWNMAKAASKGTSPVVPQLGMALAAMASHWPAEHWGGDAIAWMMERLSKEAPDVAIQCTMNLLAMLPEEAESRHAVRPERRRDFVDELIKCVPSALQLLCKCLESQQTSRENHDLALNAYAAWLRLGEAFEEKMAGKVSLCSELANHPLTKVALTALQSEDNFEAAVDVAVELIRLTCSDQETEPNAVQTPLVQVIVPLVMQMRPLFQKTCHPDSDFDDNIVKGMATLFAEIGEAYVGLISTGAQHVMEPLQVLLEVAGHPDFQVAEISFRFWERMGNILIPGHGSPADRSETEARRVQPFLGIFETLIGLVMRRVIYAVNYDHLSRDEQHDFQSMRTSIGDILADASCLLGLEKTLSVLCIPLQETSANVAAGHVFDWRAVEGALYCIKCIHLQTNFEYESQTLHSVLSSLSQMPREPILLATSADLVAGYSQWIGQISGQPAGAQLLASLLTLLGDGLSVSKSADASSRAINKLCIACPRDLASMYVDPLLQMCHHAVGKDLSVAIGSSDSVAGLSEDGIIDIIVGIATVSSCLSVDKLEIAVGSIFKPLSDALQTLLSGNILPHSSEMKQVILISDRLVALLRNIGQPDVVASAFRQLWPLVDAALSKAGSDFDAAERLCRLCNYSLMKSGSHAAGFLQHLVPIVQQRFEQQGHSCYIYSASQMIKYFGSKEEYKSSLAALVRGFLVTCISRLRSVQDFDANPDLADDCFLLAGRCLRYTPGILVITNLIEPLVDWALIGVHVQHRNACFSILDFFQKLILVAKNPVNEQEAAKVALAVIPPRGPLLIRKLLAGAAGALPWSYIDMICDTLIDILALGGMTAFEWTNAALLELPQSVSQPKDVEFLLYVSREASQGKGGRDHRRQFGRALDEFSFLCSRNHRSREAALRSLLPS